MARAVKITAGTGAVTAALLSGGSATIFYGLSVVATDSPMYVKLWWEGTGTPPPTTPGGAQPATSAPVAGTTIPHISVPIPAGGLFGGISEPICNGGRIWFWVSATPGDGAQAVLPIGGDLITFFVD